MSYSVYEKAQTQQEGPSVLPHSLHGGEESSKIDYANVEKQSDAALQSEPRFSMQTSVQYLWRYVRMRTRWGGRVQKTLESVDDGVDVDHSGLTVRVFFVQVHSEAYTTQTDAGGSGRRHCCCWRW